MRNGARSPAASRCVFRYMRYRASARMNATFMNSDGWMESPWNSIQRRASPRPTAEDQDQSAQAPPGTADRPARPAASSRTTRHASSASRLMPNQRNCWAASPSRAGSQWVELQMKTMPEQRQNEHRGEQQPVEVLDSPHVPLSKPRRGRCSPGATRGACRSGPSSGCGQSPACPRGRASRSLGA